MQGCSGMARARWPGGSWHGTAWIAVAQKWLARHGTEMYGTASAGTARHGPPWQASPWHGTARTCMSRHGLWHSMSPAQLSSQIPTWALGRKLQVAFQTAYGYLTEILRLQRALKVDMSQAPLICFAYAQVGRELGSLSFNETFGAN